jgi:hypothetical protein
MKIGLTVNVTGQQRMLPDLTFAFVEVLFVPNSISALAFAIMEYGCV